MYSLIFFEVLRYSLGSLFWGILLTLVGVGLLFFIIRGFYPRSTFTPLSFLVGAILFVLLAFQAVLLCGAVRIKGYSDEVRMCINRSIPAYWSGNTVDLTPGECQELLDRVIEAYPLVGYYVDYADFRGFNTQNIADNMVDELHSYLNKFIWRRVGWSFLFVAIGAFIVIKTLDVYRAVKRGGRRRAHRSYRYRDY